MADDAASEDPPYVICSECGARAASSWSFCRSCNASLEDARPPDDPAEVTDQLPFEETGCPKCAHEEAEIDNIATSGDGPTRLFDVQNRRFTVVTCTNCGYSELYRDQDGDIVLDLFFGG